MSITPKWAEKYSPAEMTRNSWIPLDMSTITDYPSSGKGKGAQLSYIVGMESGTSGVSSTNPSYVRLVDGNSDTLGDITPVNDSIHGGIVNALNVRIAESITTLSAFQIDATGISCLDIQASLNRPDTTIYESITIAPTSIETITFPRRMLTIEAFNNSQDIPVYVGFNTMDLPTLSSSGLPILPESFYSIDRQTERVYVGNVDTTKSIDIRVIGHYRNI
jgi:hypothetical protein